MIINTITGIEAFEKAALHIKNPPRGIQLNFWPTFNELTGGLRERELTIFCGNTGAGKTQFLANLATQLLLQKEKIFIASVETGAIDFSVRMMSVLSGKDLNTGTAHIDASVMNPIRSYFNELQENVFFSTHENRVDVIDMIETLKVMSEVHGVTVAIMDNLNFFLKVSKSQDMNMAYDEAVHNFVIAVKHLPIHVFLVMHPKKTESKGSQKILSEFDIKGSSTAVQEASNVLLMNRLDESELGALGSSYTRELVFKKIRKRGFNVNKKFYLNYEGGVYVERKKETQKSFIGV
jgi:KaiC/GvpD/RAD55 family RecA-like ATPase